MTNDNNTVICCCCPHYQWWWVPCTLVPLNLANGDHTHHTHMTWHHHGHKWQPPPTNDVHCTQMSPINHRWQPSAHKQQSSIHEQPSAHEQCPAPTSNNMNPGTSAPHLQTMCTAHEQATPPTSIIQVSMNNDPAPMDNDPGPQTMTNTHKQWLLPTNGMTTGTHNQLPPPMDNMPPTHDKHPQTENPLLVASAHSQQWPPPPQMTMAQQHHSFSFHQSPALPLPPSLIAPSIHHCPPLLSPLHHCPPLLPLPSITLHHSPSPPSITLHHSLPSSLLPPPPSLSTTPPSFQYVV